jgi:hypothetical protein
MKLFFTLIIGFVLSHDTVSANILPVSPVAVASKPLTDPGPWLPDISKMKIKTMEKLLGRKMKLKEKIAFKVLQWKIKKGYSIPKERPNRGRTAMILGIIGLASLFIPYLNIISIPCTILALVFGYQARNANPQDHKAKTAIVLGWVTVGLYVLVLLIAVILLSTATWSFG